MNSRNRQLAGMLDQAMSDLRAASVSKTDDKNTYIKAMDLAIAKVEFVKVYLEDSTMPLPTESSEVIPSSPLQQTDEYIRKAQPTDPVQVALPETPNPPASILGDFSTPPVAKIIAPESPSKNTIKPGSSPVLPEIVPPLDLEQTTTEPIAEKHLSARPVPLPTRSSIAQSNFAWMLEPDESSSPSPPKSSSPFLKSSRKPTSGASREKAAFLFGEDGGDSNASSPRFPPVSDADEGFNMGTIRGSKGKSYS